MGFLSSFAWVDTRDHSAYHKRYRVKKRETDSTSGEGVDIIDLTFPLNKPPEELKLSRFFIRIEGVDWDLWEDETNKGGDTVGADEHPESDTKTSGSNNATEMF